MVFMSAGEAQRAIEIIGDLAGDVDEGGDFTLRGVDRELIILVLTLGALVSGHAEWVNGFPVLRE